MSRAREAIEVPLGPAEAEALWTDVERWPTFVEGFKHVVERSPEWPAPGAAVVWESVPGGRGRVTERVAAREPGARVVTRIFEDRMAGEQAATFQPAPGGGTLVTVELGYELSQRGPLRAVANVLFIRRAISDAVARTLRRYAVEAAEQAELGGAAPERPTG